MARMIASVRVRMSFSKEAHEMHNLLCDYQKVYQMLEDEESRDIYLNRLNAMISGDYRYIAHIVKIGRAHV